MDWQIQMRHGLLLKIVSDELVDISIEVTTNWQEAHAPEALNQYNPADIYNTDQFELACKWLPNKAFVACPSQSLASLKTQVVLRMCAPQMLGHSLRHSYAMQTGGLRGKAKKFSGLRK